MQRNTQNGFTLIELMIAVAVVAILAAIAYPSYQDSIVKSRRADAKSALLELSVIMERLYTATGCYNSGIDKVCGGTSTDDGNPTARTTPPLLPFDVAPKSAFNSAVAAASVKANYDLAVTATASAFTITATPRSNAPDTGCTSLTLTNAGVKGVGSSATKTANYC